MEGLENCVGRVSETEIIDLQDSGIKGIVEKILTKTAKRKLKRKEKSSAPKQIKAKKNKSVNTEHLIPKTRGGSNHAHNFKKSDIKKHAGKHCRLGVKLPHEQLGQILEDNFQVLHEETRQEVVTKINSILEMYLTEGKFYSEKCFVDRTKIPRKLELTNTNEQ